MIETLGWLVLFLFFACWNKLADVLDFLFMKKEKNGD